MTTHGGKRVNERPSNVSVTIDTVSIVFQYSIVVLCIHVKCLNLQLVLLRSLIVDIIGWVVGVKPRALG